MGFKAVHAGPLNAPQIIGDEFLAAMKEFCFFAPAHNPPYIAAIKAFQHELPRVPMVAVMEPFPYRFMNEASTTYAVPYEWRSTYGIRRYGFHGASHRSQTSTRARRWAAPTSGTSPAILAAVPAWPLSAAAWQSTPVFGTSPQSGLPQNNRVGDIDAFAVLHMMKKLKLDPDQMGDAAWLEVGTGGASAEPAATFAI